MQAACGNALSCVRSLTACSLLLSLLSWSDPGKQKKKKDRCIPVNTVTGLFEQNQTAAFTKHKLPKDRMNRCFSIVGKNRTLDLEAKSKEIVDAFMTGIHRILSGSGFGVKEVTAQDADEMMSQVLINNTFVIKCKLRNLPPMPWASDDQNDTLIVMEEKQEKMAKFKVLEQSDWQKGNSNPNFEKELLLPFTIPPTNHPIKFNVYDHQLNDKHFMGASVVRLDFFVRSVHSGIKAVCLRRVALFCSLSCSVAHPVLSHALSLSSPDTAARR
jgi:hypothetical protein